MYYSRYLLFIFWLLYLGLYTLGCSSSDDDPIIFYHSIFLYNDTDYDLKIEYYSYSLNLNDIIGIDSLITEDVDFNARDTVDLTVASYDPTWGNFVIVYGDIRKQFEFADEFITMHIYPMDLEE